MLVAKMSMAGSLRSLRDKEGPGVAILDVTGADLKAGPRCGLRIDPTGPNMMLGGKQ